MDWVYLSIGSLGCQPLRGQIFKYLRRTVDFMDSLCNNTLIENETGRLKWHLLKHHVFLKDSH